MLTEQEFDRIAAIRKQMHGGSYEEMSDCGKAVHDLLALISRLDTENERQGNALKLLAELAEHKPEMQLDAAAPTILGLLCPLTDEDIKRGIEIATQHGMLSQKGGTDEQ